MDGPLGVYSPNLDPLTALGIEARSDEERRRFAELQVVAEARRIEKTLTYQRAYDEAWQRLHPGLERIAFAGAGDQGSAAGSGRLAVFVRDGCAECGAVVQRLQSAGTGFDLYMVGTRQDDERIREYPTCDQWWSDDYYGLRARLLSQVDPDLLTRMGNWAGFISREDVDDSVIRAIASPQQQNVNRGEVYTDYGGQVEMTLPNILARGAGNIGMSVGSLGFFPAMDVMRQALPMVLSLLKMALVICIPLVLVIGTYDLKMLVVVSIVQFSLFFVDFWFQLARWIDSTILDALYGWGFGAGRPHTNFNPLIGINNAFGDMLLNFVMATMFIVLPTFWVAALAWAGVRAGGIVSAFSTGTNQTANAGGRGSGAVSPKLR